MFRERSSSTAAEVAEHNEMVRKSFDWVLQVRRLTIQLLQHLSETVDACENFCLNHTIYFQNLSNLLDGERSLTAIQITLNELESLKKQLECKVERCSQFAKDVSLNRLMNSLTHPKTLLYINTNIFINLYSSNFSLFLRALKWAISSTR
jgi:hypothetical protein